MTENRNLTLNLPAPLIRKLRIYAAQRSQSMTAVVKEAVERITEENSESHKAAKRLIERLRNSPDRNVGGKITWARDQLYDR